MVEIKTTKTIMTISETTIIFSNFFNILKLFFVVINELNQMNCLKITIISFIFFQGNLVDYRFAMISSHDKYHTLIINIGSIVFKVSIPDISEEVQLLMVWHNQRISDFESTSKLGPADPLQSIVSGYRLR